MRPSYGTGNVGLALIHNPLVHSADVIFVHGLIGHRCGTWETKTGEFWLEWLGERLPQIRVWTFGYNVHTVSGSHDPHIFHVFATQLLMEMSSHLSDQSNGTIEKPIVFVAHSLGGILVKKAMILASSSESGWNYILRNTAGIVFLGTPHRGSRPLAPAAASIFNYIPGSSQILPVLQANPSTLAEIAEQFSHIWGSRPLFSFRETTRSLGIMIVRQENAITNCQTETVVDIPRCNHSEISKPDSTNSVLFTRILYSLFSLLQPKSADAHSSTVGSYNPESLVKLPRALVRQNPIGSIRDGGRMSPTRMSPTTTLPKSNWAGESRGSSNKTSTRVAPADLTVIARDVAQEACLNFPIIPKSISQRRNVFLAARTVKEMCDTAVNGNIVTPIIDEEDPADAQFQRDVADLLLYSALILEYTADFLAKRSPAWITSESMSVLDKLGEVKDMLNRIAPEDKVKVDIYKRMLLNALASDLQIDSGTVTQFIDSSSQRHSVGSQEAENFIECNRNWGRSNKSESNRSDIANLTTFIENNSVSLLALRSDRAQTFLNILEQAARSDSIATPDKKRRWQTYLRRLSCRSGLLPSTFYLSNVKPTNNPVKRCEHCPQGKPLSGPGQSLQGGSGSVRLAKWKKPGGKVVNVAIKKLMIPNPETFCHEAAFWHSLDTDKVVPFYGVAFFENKYSPESCLVSQWMDGGCICCYVAYVDDKEDSIRFNLLHQVADGIKYLHDLNFVHCDIKPGNILIDTRGSLHKALIMDFGFSNAERLTNVAYSAPCGSTRGYVPDNFSRWDPNNDVYAFGVTCCQVVLVNRWRDITSIPEDIKTCVTASKPTNVAENPAYEEGSKDSRQPIIQSLFQKFLKDKKPVSRFVHEVFRLVAFTCSTPPRNMDYVVDLFKSASSLSTTAISKSTDAHSSTVGSYNPESLAKLPHALVRQNPIGSIRDGGHMSPTTTHPKSNLAGGSRGSSNKTSTRVAPADLTEIARDVVQETCFNFPIIPKSISQRREIFLAARTVKEMCETAVGESIVTPIIDAVDPADLQLEHDVADLLLYSALIVEYAADFLVKYSLTRITSESMSVLNELGKVKDMLNRFAPEDTIDIDTHKIALINALASDLQIDSGAVTQSIDSSFQRHSVGSQDAKDFIKCNPNWNRYGLSDIEKLATFIKKNSVSLLALRSEHALTFLNILEQAARSDSIATPDEKRRYQAYLRRLSCRSGLHPSTFYLSDVKPINSTLKPCDHYPRRTPLPGPVRFLEGGFGTVRIAEWKKPGGKVVNVAIKKLMIPNSEMFCHEAAFWRYLDADKVVPFYGVAFFENKYSPESCLVSQWMDGGPICCYVDNKEDFIRFNLLRQAADAIKYLHDLNLVHCDIKPMNILIDTRGSLPKALIMNFGLSNAARLTNVAYSAPCGYTHGYVDDSANFNHWDPSNDVYAFGVTCCQVILVNKRRVITSIPEDIEICVTVSKLPSVAGDSDGKGSKGSRQEIIQSLYQKFFPDKKPASPFVYDVCRLAAFTCSTPPCNMDYVVDFFKNVSSLSTTASSSSLF